MDQPPKKYSIGYKKGLLIWNLYKIKLLSRQNLGMNRIYLPQKLKKLHIIFLLLPKQENHLAMIVFYN